MVLDKSAQNQDRFTSKIDASLGCDDDREGWHTYHQYGEEGHGAQQHCGEGDTSVWQDQITKKLNIPNLYKYMIIHKLAYKSWHQKLQRHVMEAMKKKFDCKLE